MRSRVMFQIQRSLVVFLLLTGSAKSEIRVGVAEVDITPPIGGLTTGYSSARPTDGIHDPVSARVMLLQSDQHCIACVVCDLCIYNSAWLHEQMESIGVTQLLLMNTHTHAGPKMSQEDFPSVEEPWNVTVEQRLMSAIREARDNTFAASFAAAEGAIPLGYNRLVRDGKIAVTHFENPERIPYGPIDPRVSVIRVTDQHNNVRAVIVNYACHPVILGPRNRKISADYPGVVREIIEQHCGEDCLCLFIQGAGGDINPLMMARGDDREQDFEVVETLGRLLAEEVKEALDSISAVPGKSESLQAASTEAMFRSRWDAAQSVAAGVTTLLINDDIGIITMPGEPFHHFQMDFRRRADVRHTLMFGYCSNGPYDWPRYLPDMQSAARGGYGASDTTVAEVGAGERLVDLGHVQLLQLQGRLKSTPQRHPFEPETR